MNTHDYKSFFIIKSSIRNVVMYSILIFKTSMSFFILEISKLTIIFMTVKIIKKYGKYFKTIYKCLDDKYCLGKRSNIRNIL